ncbi:unnamed protein product [Schistosoma turkestanicum]|nr:unnamed protein product [Schistosoma turkestanicum]CAH8560020.1 unnamed protein product [Schistosoma turkestanicum]
MSIINTTNYLDHVNSHHCDRQVCPSSNNILRRGRASERQHLICQRRINYHQHRNQPLKPISAPLTRTFII